MCNNTAEMNVLNLTAGKMEGKARKGKDTIK